MIAKTPGMSSMVEELASVVKRKRTTSSKSFRSKRDTETDCGCMLAVITAGAVKIRTRNTLIEDFFKYLLFINVILELVNES